MTKQEKRNLTLLIALLSAFPPLSIDMYLPAIPLLQDIWKEPLSTINLTLVSFFIGYCVSLLFYGPLSDKYGRRPILLTGIIIYTLSSLLASFSDSAISLIILRAFQGIGAASGSAISLAITKDLFDGEERKKILSTIAIIMPLAPMLAPTLGGWIMLCFSWHWIFVAQAIIGTIAFMGVLRMKESSKQFYNIKLYEVRKVYLQLFKNRKYIILVLLFSFSSLVHFSFIGSAADIYITRLGLSEHVFGYFFAFNGLAIMFGAFASKHVKNIISVKTQLSIALIGILVSSMYMAYQILSGPWDLALPMMIASFCFGFSRPSSSHLILEQIDSHIGSASSLMVFCNFTIAAFSMWLISLNWQDKVITIGFIGTISTVIILIIWLSINHIFFNITTKKQKVR